MPHDVVVRQFEDGENLFFLSKGSAEVYIQKINAKEKYAPRTLKEAARSANLRITELSKTKTAELKSRKSSGDDTERDEEENDVEKADLIQKIVNSELSSNSGQKTSRQLIKFLEEGAYFGEIALITNLRRTSTVRATDYCTFASMSRTVLLEAKKEYPQIYLALKKNLNNYNDADFI